MAFTKITAAGIGSTETVTIDGLSVINNESIGGNSSISGNLTVTGNANIGGVLTYEDVTNVDSVGLITARDGIVVGSGITLSVDGDGFFTGIVTATTFSGAFSGDGSALTGVANTDVIFPDKISLGDGSATDGDQINIGVGSDLKLYHNGSHSHIDNNTGNLMLSSASHIDLLNPANDEYLARFQVDGSAELYENGSKKLETDSSGVTVTGRVAATSYTGDGSALTGIEVGLSTASAQVSGITTVIDLSKDDIRLDCTGLVTVDAKGGTEGGSHSLRIVNSGIATVTFNSYFKFPSGGAPNLPTASGAISLISFTVHTQGRVGVASVFLAGSSVNFS